jgi:hypothetical protein
MFACFSPLHGSPDTLLQFDTKYYYAVGIGQTVRKFWFMTPPKSGPDVPYTFGLIGISQYSQAIAYRSSHRAQYMHIC